MRCEDLEDPIMQLENRDVKSASTQIVDGDQSLFLAIQTISERSRRGLIHDPEHVETRKPPGRARGLPLAIVEVSRHRDHRFADRLSQSFFGALLELTQNHGGDLDGCKLTLPYPD